MPFDAPRGSTLIGDRNLTCCRGERYSAISERGSFFCAHLGSFDFNLSVTRSSSAWKACSFLLPNRPSFVLITKARAEETRRSAWDSCGEWTAPMPAARLGFESLPADLHSDAGPSICLFLKETRASSCHRGRKLFE